MGRHAYGRVWDGEVKALAEGKMKGTTQVGRDHARCRVSHKRRGGPRYGITASSRKDLDHPVHRKPYGPGKLGVNPVGTKLLEMDWWRDMRVILEKSFAADPNTSGRVRATFRFPERVRLLLPNGPKTLHDLASGEKGVGFQEQPWPV